MRRPCATTRTPTEHDPECMQHKMLENEKLFTIVHFTKTMVGAMIRASVATPDGATCTSLGLPGRDDDDPTLVCSGCIEYTYRCSVLTLTS
jgi:hypothetical protein